MQYFVVILVSLILSACSGTLGGIREVAQTYNEKVVIDGRVILSSIGMAADAPVNNPIGAMDLGVFSYEDLEIVRESISKTLGQYNTSGENEFKVHVYFHKYFQSYSNVYISGLAIVDWALVKNSQIIHSEAFYASFGTRANSLTGNTLGTAKDRLNISIINKIAKTTFNLAGNNKYFDIDALPNIYANGQLATDSLPKSMRSSGVLIGNIYTPGVSADTNYNQHTFFEKIDWPARLGLPEVIHGTPD